MSAAAPALPDVDAQRGAPAPAHASSGASAAAPLEIKQLQVDDAATARRWDDFVRGCPSATFFHLSGWQRVIQRQFKHRCFFFYVERDGRIASLADVLVLKALDAEGKKLFTIEHKKALREQVDPEVVARLVAAMMATPGVKEMEGNSTGTPSSSCRARPGRSST